MGVSDETVKGPGKSGLELGRFVQICLRRIAEVPLCLFNSPSELFFLEVRSFQVEQGGS